MKNQKNYTLCGSNIGKLINIILILVVALFSGIKLFECINVEEAMHLYPEYNQTWLKMSENLNSDRRLLISNTINQKLNTEYGSKIVVNIPTKNKMVVYTNEKVKESNIKKIINVLPKIEFKSQNGNQLTAANIKDTDIKKANITTLSDGQWAIEIEFTEDGAEKFARLTKSIIGQRLAIFYDGNLISSPVIREEITGGRAIITEENGFAYDDVKNLVTVLNSSNLSYQVLHIEKQNIINLVFMALLFIASLIGGSFLVVLSIKNLLEKSKCSNCGYINKFGQKFCSKCGTEL